jgi:Tfp pilus assembly protein PilF
LAYGQKGDIDKAIADLTDAIRLDPKSAGTYHDRGLAYHKKGEEVKAKEDFAQAKKLGYKPGPSLSP